MTESTAPEPTKLWFLLDRSGSMGQLTEDVIGGFNTFIGEQAQASGNAHLPSYSSTARPRSRLSTTPLLSERSRRSRPKSINPEVLPPCWMPSVSSSNTQTGGSKPDLGKDEIRRINW